MRKGLLCHKVNGPEKKKKNLLGYCYHSMITGIYHAKNWKGIRHRNRNMTFIDFFICIKTYAWPKTAFIKKKNYFQKSLPGGLVMWSDSHHVQWMFPDHGITQNLHIWEHQKGLIHRDYYMAIFISYPIPTRDTLISPRAFSPRADMGVLGWYGVWYENCHIIIYLSYIFLSGKFAYLIL